MGLVLTTTLLSCQTLSVAMACVDPVEQRSRAWAYGSVAVNGAAILCAFLKDLPCIYAVPEAE